MNDAQTWHWAASLSFMPCSDHGWVSQLTWFGTHFTWAGWPAPRAHPMGNIWTLRTISIVLLSPW